MGLEFIDRSLKTTGIVLLIALPFSFYYFGVYPAIAFFSGGVWGMLNLLLISRLVRAALRPEGALKGATLFLAIFKFPLLYVAGYFLISVPQFDPLHLVYGFTSLLVIIVLRGIGIAMLGTDESTKARSVA
ncbi:MAG: hypothetical protein DRP45_04335 [Candidatus Zixiibacteriota bacterium]|nr:MAG: hypothetical protein DRP45_04335 [candidate division Zixibacteria bacterium]